MDRAEISSRLSEGMALLDRIPSVAEAVQSLVWAVVPVDVEGPAYDTGYSDPAIPFSIFIGIHAPGEGAPAIRLAEGILHETMHLQLSLIEDVLPMIAGRTELRVSPWQRRPRPMQGLLHGLYVFRVIQDWYAALLDCDALDASEGAQAQKRLAEIKEECATLKGLASSQDLTRHGRQLAASLAAGPPILQSSGA
jgi:HEXXH motif-containing protein